LFDFLKRADPLAQKPGSPDHSSTRYESTQLAGGSQHEVIGVVLKDILRMHEIPATWVECEIRQVPLGPNRMETQVHLIITRWSEQLLRYAAALQAQFMAGLDSFEPHVDHSSYTVLWRFAKKCDLPFPTIPEHVKWHVSASQRVDDSASTSLAQASAPPSAPTST
jgi:hypothetical protein